MHKLLSIALLLAVIGFVYGGRIPPRNVVREYGEIERSQTATANDAEDAAAGWSKRDDSPEYLVSSKLTQA